MGTSDQPGSHPGELSYEYLVMWHPLRMQTSPAFVLKGQGSHRPQVCACDKVVLGPRPRWGFG